MIFRYEKCSPKAANIAATAEVVNISAGELRLLSKGSIIVQFKLKHLTMMCPLP